MKTNSSNLLPKVAIFSFMFMISAFVWEKYSFKDKTVVSMEQTETTTSVASQDVSIKSRQLKKTPETASTEKAYIESTQIDPVTKQVTYKMHLPKGKRLYNEEQMREIASDVPVDVLSSEDSNI